jgi:hypothetical protein
VSFESVKLVLGKPANKYVDYFETCRQDVDAYEQASRAGDHFLPGLCARQWSPRWSGR